MPTSKSDQEPDSESKPDSKAQRASESKSVPVTQPEAAVTGEPFLLRAQLVPRRPHQRTLGVLWALCFSGILLNVASQYWSVHGLAPLETEPIEYRFEVDANRASWPEFANLPGIGETLARAIVAHRQERGGYQALPDLEEVPGIGPAKLNEMGKYLVFPNWTVPAANDDPGDLE